MTQLTPYFDARCGLCVTTMRWLAGQHQLIPLLCIPKNEGVDDLVVCADTGEVWRGDSAWLMAIWALDDFRGWSYRLASPELLPLARQAFAMLSANRGLISHWFGLKADADLAARLSEVTVPECSIQSI